MKFILKLILFQAHNSFYLTSATQVSKGETN